MNARLNLVVIRCSDIETSVTFYRKIGLSFVKHRHGKGAEHYASESDGFVFELYSATEEFPVSIGTRLGFQLEDVDEIMTQLESDTQVLTAPTDSPWGRRAVIVDPDGHKIELTNQ